MMTACMQFSIITNSVFNVLIKGCINDIRVNGDWLPMDQSQNRESHAANYSLRSQNIEDGCASSACVSGNVVCPYGLICIDLWRYAQCRSVHRRFLTPSFLLFFPILSS